MLRTYKLKHYINIGKQRKILNLLKEYRKVSDEISNRQWRYFYEKGRFNRDLEVNSIKSELSKRYIGKSDEILTYFKKKPALIQKTF